MMKMLMDEWIKQCKYARYQLPQTCSFTCPQVNFLELIRREVEGGSTQPKETQLAHSLITLQLLQAYLNSFCSYTHHQASTHSNQPTLTFIKHKTSGEFLQMVSWSKSFGWVREGFYSSDSRGSKHMIFKVVYSRNKQP